MKKVLSFLMILMLVFSCCAYAETEKGAEPETVPVPAEEEGDDSNPVPVDMMEEEELEVEVELLTGRIIQYGDTGDDVKALQTRLKDLQYYTGETSGKYGNFSF